MSRSEWFTLHDTLRDMLARSISLRDCVTLLLGENQRYGSWRCTARWKIDRDGVPILAYCRKWPCWIHGETRLWLETQRIVYGAKTLTSEGDLWFITIYLSDASTDTSSGAAKHRARFFIRSLDFTQP